MSDTGGEEINDLVHENYPPTSCIYALLDPRNDDYKYIGKTKDPVKRLNKHIHSDGSIHIKKWVDELKKDSLLPRMIIVNKTTKLNDREKFWIRYHLTRGADLLNNCAYSISIRGHAIGYS